MPEYKSTWEKLKATNSSFKDSYFEDQMNTRTLYSRDKIDLYNKIYRFGRLDPYNNLGNTKEYLFFTKPDLNIVTGSSEGAKLNNYLITNPFFMELYEKYPKVISQLQKSADKTNNPLCTLLTNSVSNNLDLPSLSANTIQNSVNVWGTSYEYRGSSEAGNDNFDFSLEFMDTAHLDVYHFFKAYDEYQTLKSHGTVRPKKEYITNKILHDQIGIYKILVDADMETIVYYAYFCGVMFKSLPRDAFSSSEFSNGATYSIDMKAAFMEDLNPLILRDLNYITDSYRRTHTSKELPVYDVKSGTVSGVPAVCPYITTKVDIAGRTRYALKWRY